ncbi:autotransporter outer membrane beta-barrel domain-containing protein, partial [Bordetella petrii]|uniref:autotransporter outer membrane beta-barrel domain-containing protein n=1 Tax=Bordetella petrii TaxID=94624 RepID=UPI001E4B314D
GGAGGSGGLANANLSGSSVVTYGAGSYGMLVQSVGGGGGAGGNATSTSTVIGTESTASATVSAAFGGSGGAAACSTDYATSTCGSNTTVSLQGNNLIQTWGDSANGIVAQSIGGGGGAGGIGSATGSSRNTDADISAHIYLGGTGGGGGSGNQVNFASTYTDSVQTAGDGARGILLQSIGGGGGASQGGQIGLALSSESEDSSTDVKATVTVGRGGTAGGAGGNLAITSNGNITTFGADADGLVAQSIGGSGGLGGIAGGNSADPSTGLLRKAMDTLGDVGTSYELTASVGGMAGGGGNGGAIGSSSAAASFGSQINTHGDYADALVLQSIGGGGGQGGASNVASSSATSALTLSVGGSGGNGGNGGSITAYFNDDYIDSHLGNLFNTYGYGAHGVVLQSIGGGGGIAASGTPKAQGTITVGGTGGGGGDGGSITVNTASWANISTHGDSAYGLILQSIGGGGGIGMSGNTDAAASPGSSQIELQLGGGNGVKGDGGAISVAMGLGMNTYGHRAIGVLAQSIGGGGGVAISGAGDNVSKVGFTGATGNGGKVDLNITGGAVTTHGDGAHAIVAQSIGGGGGIFGDTALGIQLDPNAAGIAPVTATGSGGGKDVTVSVNGNIATYGRNAFGIIAQSLSGSGGLGGTGTTGYAGLIPGTAGNVSGAVQVNQSGTLAVSGEGSTGIFAQTASPIDSDPVTINVNGQVQGGSGSNAYGIWVTGGFANAINVAATGSVAAASGIAVRFDAYSTEAINDLTLNNNGTVNGSVVCASGATSLACPTTGSGDITAAPAPAAMADSTGRAIQINNRAGGTLAGATQYQANVLNEGLLIIGNPGTHNELAIDGALVQRSGGVLRADVDFDRLATDHLTVNGNATLAGVVDVIPSTLLPGREVTVATVKGAAQGALQAVDSPVVDYVLRQDGQDYKVRVNSAEFDAPAMDLASNQDDVAGYLQRIWDTGGNPALAPLFAQLDLASRTGGGAYRQNLDSLTPGATIAPAAQSMAAMGHFTDNMLSCPAFTGTDAITGEQDCFWGIVARRSTRQDGSRGSSDFDYDSMTYQFGGQRQVSPGWFVGGSVAYQNNNLNGDGGRLNGDGDSGYAGMVLKRESGPWTFSGALGGGYGSYRMNREVVVPGYQETLKSDPDLYNFGLRLRAARTFSFDNVYVKPYLDLDANYTRMSSYSESGDSALGLSVDSSSQFVLGASPMVEIGGKATLPNGALMRPFAYAGVTFLNKDSWDATTRLQGAPAGTGTFNTTLPMDDVIGRLGAGLQVSTEAGVDFRLQYDAELASEAKSHSGSLKVMIPF